MKYNFEGVDEDRSKVEGPWDDIQGSGTESAAVWQQNLGGDGGNVEDPGGFSVLGGQTDHGDGVNICGGQEVGIPPNGGGTGSNGLTPHSGVHSKMTGNHRGTGGMPPHP